ncbi:MAG: hypothetical protein MJ180_01370 [Candidatus Gastranaerophilales bacterium]|nr:hypothetical protein [Candidatus Gastranaerophilales bacterium]
MLEFNGTTIVIAISFILFVIIENLIFYKPMKKTLEERANYISGNEQDAQKNLSEAKSLVDEKDKKIANAKGRSSQILNEASIKSQENFDVAVKQAKRNSNSKIEEVKKNLEDEKVAVQNELRKEIGTHAATIISKILKKDVAVVNVNDEIVDKAMRGEL